MIAAFHKNLIKSNWGGIPHIAYWYILAPICSYSFNNFAFGLVETFKYEALYNLDFEKYYKVLLKYQ